MVLCMKIRFTYIVGSMSKEADVIIGTQAEVLQHHLAHTVPVHYIIYFASIEV